MIKFLIFLKRENSSILIIFYIKEIQPSQKEKEEVKPKQENKNKKKIIQKKKIK
jgi:hypothetical protein